MITGKSASVSSSRTSHCGWDRRQTEPERTVICRLAKVGNTKQTICSFSLGSVKPRQGREVNCVRLLGRPVKKGLPDGEGTVSQNCEGHFLGLLSCDPEDPSAKYEVNGIEP